MAFLLFTPSPVNLRSTAAGLPVNGGQRRQSTVVNDGHHRRTSGQRWRSTTVNGGGPSWTTGGPPVKAGQQLGR
ncbi:hypothetical protein Tco_1072117, partial [Tanacetum coccineum]